MRHLFPERAHNRPLSFPHRISLALIAAGAAIDSHKIKIQALFFVAVEFGIVDVVERLIQEGVAFGEKNIAGRSALEVAKANGYWDIVGILRANESNYVNGFEKDDLSQEENVESCQMNAFRRIDIWDEKDDGGVAD